MAPSALPTIIVTGANRGIGRALCAKILADTSLPPFRLLATSRSGEDLDLAPPPSAGEVRVQYPKLDISDPASVKALADLVQRDGGKGSVRCLVNNAGVNLDEKYGVENARRTVGVNVWGTLDMCQTFIPLLAPSGRIVNLSSVASSLKACSEMIQQRFRNPDITISDIRQLEQEFLDSVSKSTESSAGFMGPGRSYSFSKACVNALTHLLARDNPGLVVNCLCPGWVATDMGKQVGRPPKTPEEGSRVVFRAGFGDLAFPAEEGEGGMRGAGGDVTGRYWANESVRSRGEGGVMPW